MLSTNLRVFSRPGSFTPGEWAHSAHRTEGWVGFRTGMDVVEIRFSKLPVASPYIDRAKTKKLNSMVWVRERTIPTERPPLVGEVIANLCG
jgi:hypothetical protein